MGGSFEISLSYGRVYNVSVMNFHDPKLILLHSWPLCTPGPNKPPPENDAEIQRLLDLFLVKSCILMCKTVQSTYRCGHDYHEQCGPTASRAISGN